MLQYRATLQEIRYSLQKELRTIFPENESGSLVRIILEHVGYPSPALLSNPDHVPEPDIVRQINEIVAEINTERPIQYILGYTHFFDLKLKVNQNVLIPRPETEELVHKIIEKETATPVSILDIGTGSGCLALALKKQFPEASVTGIDISSGALEVAAENGSKNGLEVNWILSDMTALNPLKGSDAFELIVSNPPYVRRSEGLLMNANVIHFEPEEALFVSDSDPLQYYRSIASLAMDRLHKNGSLWVEINEKLGLETANLLLQAGMQEVYILKDIHEKERFIRAKKQSD